MTVPVALERGGKMKRNVDENYRRSNSAQKRDFSPHYNHLTLDLAAQVGSEFYMTTWAQTGVGGLLLGKVPWGYAI